MNPSASGSILQDQAKPAVVLLTDHLSTVSAPKEPAQRDPLPPLLRRLEVDPVSSAAAVRAGELRQRLSSLETIPTNEERGGRDSNPRSPRGPPAHKADAVSVLSHPRSSTHAIARMHIRTAIAYVGEF